MKRIRALMLVDCLLIFAVAFEAYYVAYLWRHEHAVLVAHVNGCDVVAHDIAFPHPAEDVLFHPAKVIHNIVHPESYTGTALMRDAGDISTPL